MTINDWIASPRASWATLPLLIATAGACTTEVAAPVETDAALSAQLGLDAEYMWRVAGATAPHPVDLADPGQHRFVIDRLAAAGKTPASEPALFAQLEAARTKALRAGGGAGLTAIDGCVTALLPGVQRRINAPVSFVHTQPVVSCFGGAAFVFSDLTTFLSNATGSQNFVVASRAAEDDRGGVNFRLVRLDPTLPGGRNRVNRSDSLTLAFDELGNEAILFNAFATSLQVTANIVVEEPESAPAALPFPTRGTVRVTASTNPCSIQSIDLASSRLRLVNEVRGGFCTTGLGLSAPAPALAEGTRAFESLPGFRSEGGGPEACDETTLHSGSLTPLFTITGTALCGDDLVPFVASHTTGDPAP